MGGMGGLAPATGFMDGLNQGLGLYNVTKRTQLYEQEIENQRERQKAQDALELKKTEAYLKNLEETGRINQAQETRAQEIFNIAKIKDKVGKLADQISAAQSLENAGERTSAFDRIAEAVNNDPDLAKALDLNPEIGGGQGRKLVTFHELNPSEKDARKRKMTPLVFNEALNSVGPYTSDRGARWPQQAGMVFDVDTLYRMAGRTEPEKHYYQTAKGWTANPEGIMPYESPKAPVKSEWDDVIETDKGFMTKREAAKIGAHGIRTGGGDPGKSLDYVKKFSEMQGVAVGGTYTKDEMMNHLNAGDSWGLGLDFSEIPGETSMFGKDSEPTYRLNSITMKGEEAPAGPGGGQQQPPPSGQVQKLQRADGSIYFTYNGNEYNSIDEIRKALSQPAPSQQKPAKAGGSGIAPKPKKAGTAGPIVGEDALYDTTPAGKPTNKKTVAPGVSVKKSDVPPQQPNSGIAPRQTASSRKITALGAALADPATPDKEATRKWIKDNYGEDVLAKAEKESMRIINDRGKPTLSWRSATGEKYIDLK